MKKNVIKTAVAAVCVVAAGMGGFKAYNVANQSQANMLLAENIDAFSLPEKNENVYLVKGQLSQRDCERTEVIVHSNGTVETRTYKGKEGFCDSSKSGQCDMYSCYSCIYFSIP